MWIFILALSFLPAPAAGLLFGLRALWRAGRQEKLSWTGLALTALTLGGRWWIRRLRPAGQDEPKPLTPTRRGWAWGTGGVALEWEQFGPDDAPAILFTHGLSLSHDTSYYQKTGLSDEFRVIVWNMRGAGQSEMPANRDFSIETLTDDMAVIFDATDAGRNGCVLAGHSLGAMLLPVFAHRHQEKMNHVAGLAMLGGTDRPVLESMWGSRWLSSLRRPLWEPFAHLMDRRPAPWDALTKFLRQTGMIHLAMMAGLAAGRETRGQCDLIADRCGAFSMRAAARGGLAGFSYDARPLLPAIAVPVLVMSGESDINAPPDIQRALARACADAELVLLPGCGHLSLLECHAEVNAHLRTFARQCLSRQGSLTIELTSL